MSDPGVPRGCIRHRSRFPEPSSNDSSSSVKARAPLAALPTLGDIGRAGCGDAFGQGASGHEPSPGAERLHRIRASKVQTVFSFPQRMPRGFTTAEGAARLAH
jgi:hypothetical protein